MKTFAEFIIERQKLKEEGAAPTNVVGSGNVAGCDENPPASKSKIIRRHKRLPPNA